MNVDELPAAEQVWREAREIPEVAAEWDRTALARAVALRLIGYRAEHGLTQTELGRRLEMKQPAVARLESGDHNPSIETLWRLAFRLGIEFHIDVTASGLAV